MVTIGGADVGDAAAARCCRVVVGVARWRVGGLTRGVAVVAVDAARCGFGSVGGGVVSAGDGVTIIFSTVAAVAFPVALPTDVDTT